MQLKTFRADGATFVVSPYHPGISIREDVFRRQFRIQCDGRFEYPEDRPIWGTYHIDGSLRLGERGLIEEAMALAEFCVEKDTFDLSGREDLISFSPEFIIIHDDHGRHVLAGQVWGRDVRWCSPVSSRAEATEASKQADEINRQAAFERGWDNYETARRLNRDAEVIEGG